MLVEACRWQACEAELLQAVDRLRLVHHQGEPKSVHLLTSVPLPLPIDEATTLDAPAGEDRLTRLLEAAGGEVVPLARAWVAEHGGFETERAAKEWIGRLMAHTAKDTLRPCEPLKLGSYRLPGQRGPRPTPFLYRADCADPRAELERLVGPLAAYEGPDPKPALSLTLVLHATGVRHEPPPALLQSRCPSGGNSKVVLQWP